MAADLHLHSIYSDGSESPRELFRKAQQAGLDTIAITDHDTLEGSKEAHQLSEKFDLKLIPGIELSTSRENGEIHVLGYYIDYNDRNLNYELNKIFQARYERAQKMISVLRKMGINLNLSEIEEKTNRQYIGRPHIAQEMVDKGYIDEVKQAFSPKYIGNQGQAYVERYKLSSREAIELILKAGGIPVVAHPGFIGSDSSLKKNDIQQLKEDGLKGIEVFHSRHRARDIKYYKKVAAQLGLLVTGGSDFHGQSKPEVKIGDVVLEEKYIVQLENYFC